MKNATIAPSELPPSERINNEIVELDAEENRLVGKLESLRNRVESQRKGVERQRAKVAEAEDLEAIGRAAAAASERGFLETALAVQTELESALLKVDGRLTEIRMRKGTLLVQLEAAKDAAARARQDELAREALLHLVKSAGCFRELRSLADTDRRGLENSYLWHAMEKAIEDQIKLPIGRLNPAWLPSGDPLRMELQRGEALWRDSGASSNATRLDVDDFARGRYAGTPRPGSMFKAPEPLDHQLSRANAAAPQVKHQ